jgi:hypothetical protein
MAQGEEVMLPRFVYVMSRDDGAHKIGFSNNPERRCANLLSCSTHDMCVAYAVPRPDDAVDVEGFAHLLLREHALGGEWFSVDDATAISTVDTACLGYDLGALRVERTCRIEAIGDNRGYPLTRAEIVQLELAGEFGPDYAAVRRHQGYLLAENS